MHDNLQEKFFEGRSNALVLVAGFKSFCSKEKIDPNHAGCYFHLGLWKGSQC